MGLAKRILEQYQVPDVTDEGTPIDEQPDCWVPAKRFKNVLIMKDGERVAVKKFAIIDKPKPRKIVIVKKVVKIVRPRINPLEVAEYVERHAADFAAKSSPYYDLKWE